MSFLPISTKNLQESLLGIGDPTKLLESRRDDLMSRHIHGPRESSGAILLVVISAIIFITTVAVFDIIKGSINNYYSKISLTDPNSNNTNKDIQRTLIANRGSLASNFIFAMICIIIAIVIIPILYHIY